MTSKVVEKNTLIEQIAHEVKEALNAELIDLRQDYDDDQTVKIELGRDIAKQVWKNL